MTSASLRAHHAILAVSPLAAQSAPASGCGQRMSGLTPPEAAVGAALCGAPLARPESYTTYAYRD